MEIKRPRRILLLGAPDSDALKLLKDLTGSAPSPIDGSTTAGLTHIWPLKTDYYTASLPIWMDEVADADAWRTEFASPEAKEVVGALGAWIYCFRKPIDEQGYEEVKMMLKAIAKVIENACGYSWDGTCLAVATPQGITPHLEKEFEEWEESCRDHGFEYIDSEAKGRNEFGEAVGIARIREALETTDWTGDDDLDELDALGDELGDEDGLQFSDSFAAEEAEMGLELLGLKSAIAGGDESQESKEQDEQDQVEELGRMMAKLQAIKDTGAAMPEAERKKFAAKAVNDLLKSL